MPPTPRGWLWISFRDSTSYARIGPWTVNGRQTWKSSGANGCTGNGRKRCRARLTGRMHDHARERKRRMTSPFLGEFLGTMMLILLGDGVVAGVLLKRTKSEGAGWMVITAGWAFAVMAGVFTAVACGSSDAHLNPAVTLGFAVRAGSFGNYLPHWKETPDAAAKLACFCTAPAIRGAAANLLSEIIGTAVLVFVVGAIFSRAIASSGPGALGPYLVGSLGWG